MNLPERFPPDDPREWMNRARSDLTQAKNQVPGVYLENLCFNAQQAAEKSIKGVLIAREIEFPYVHDLAHLLSLLEDGGEVIPALAMYPVLSTLPATSAESSLANIASRFPLPWSAYVRLLSVKNINAREFYETEALRGGWTIRQLSRQQGFEV